MGVVPFVLSSQVDWVAASDEEGIRGKVGEISVRERLSVAGEDAKRVSIVDVVTVGSDMLREAWVSFFKVWNAV